MEAKKNIIICGTTFPFRGGLAVFKERLARELMAQGHKVTIFTWSLQYPNFLFPGKTQMSDEPAPDDLDIKIKVNSINPFNWWKVGREIKKLAPDMLLMKFWLPFMGPSLGTISRIARKNGKTKAVVIVDNMIPHERRIGDMAFIKYFAKSVDGFIAMSKSVESDINSFHTNKPVAFAPHPIYDNFGPAVPKAEAIKAIDLDPAYKYLLFFGFIRGYKGLDLALKAMADPRIKDLPVKLVVAGEYYEDSKPYTDLIAELGISDKIVQRTDFIPNAEVGKYFCAADMVVQPYKTATQSGVTQIAYHYEVPMLVTNVGGLAEIVPDGKVGYVTEVDPKAISDAIVDFYERDREAAFAAGIREEKPRFFWESFVEKIFGVYKQVGGK